MSDELGGVDSVGGSGGVSALGGGDSQELTAGDTKEIAGAVNAVDNQQVQDQALKTTEGDPNSDAFDKVTGATQATGAAARQYGKIDPTNGNGLNGAKYSDKVLKDMVRGDNHTFPTLVDETAKGAKSFAFKNGDGTISSGVEVPGARNGKPGTYEFIVDRNGDVTHRFFAKDGVKPVIPHEGIIPGTNAARIAGRIALPAAVAMDAYAIATSDNKPRTATEKAGAWAGSMALGGAAAEVASPLLAFGPPGWVGYGVAVLGAGAAGYFGGESLTNKLYTWASGSPK